MQELLCFDVNRAATESCFTAEEVLRQEKIDNKPIGSRKRDILYASRVSRENPELVHVAATFLCYKSCEYCVQQNAGIKDEVSAYLSSASGASRSRNLAIRTNSLKLTKEMCEAVKYVTEEMYAAIKTNKRIRLYLAVLTAVNGVPSLIPPASRVEYSVYAEAIRYITERYGDLFRKMMMKIMAFEETRDKTDILLHNTEMLLWEYQKCKYRGYQSYDEAVRAAFNEAGMFKTPMKLSDPQSSWTYIMGSERGSHRKMEQAVFINTIISLVDSLKEALRNYPEDGALLYEAIDFFYDSDISKSAKNVMDKFNSCDVAYKRKEKAINVMSILLWGCTAKDILDMIYNPLVRASKKAKNMQISPEN